MCLTPRNRFEFVDKLQRTQSYTTYNAEINACNYLDVDDKGKVPDIILLCETWQSKNSPVSEIDGYRIVQKYREHRKGGGVTILISENLKYRSRSDLECNTNILEHCVVEIKIGYENLLCSSCYCTPNTDVDLFLSEYALLLNNLKETKCKLVMGMDHNLDLLKYSKHHPTWDFVSLNENASLVPSITRPTHITTSSATLIDNIFVNSEFVRSLKSQILINDISDHLPICTAIENVNIGLKEKKKIVTRKLTKGKLKLIQIDLQNINWDNYLETYCDDPKDVNGVTKVLHNRICEGVNKHAPLKEVSINIRKIKSEPWMTPGIKRSSQQSKKLY